MLILFYNVIKLIVINFIVLATILKYLTKIP